MFTLVFIRAVVTHKIYNIAVTTKKFKSLKGLTRQGVKHNKYIYIIGGQMGYEPVLIELCSM